MTTPIGAMCFDDYGRPFIIIKDEDQQARLTGTEVLKSHILAARGVADKLRTSLGPRGMDKLLVSPEGDVVVTNDGATILELMDVEHEVAKLMVGLARAQDKEIGDGTTGVVVLAGALLEGALELLDKGIHPTRIAEGYTMAVKEAAAHLKTISFSVTVDADHIEELLKAATTALSSKVASKCQKHLARITVEAVKTTCDLNQSSPELHVNSIVLRGKSGGQIEDTELIRGVIIGKYFAHPQMKKSFENIKVAVFSSSALQLPMVNTKHQLSVESSKCYDDISNYIDDWCQKVIKTILDSGAKLVIYSGKIENSVIHLFLKNDISAVESVADVEMIAVSVGARVVPKVEELSCEKLGAVDKVRVIDFGTTKEKFIALEQQGKSRIVTIFVRGGNEVIVEEVKRSLQDAICVIRNLAKDRTAVYGGGSSEISCSLALQEASLKIPGIDQLVFQAFAEALDAIPLTLAQNAGLFPLQVLTELKARAGPTLGVDCMMTGDCDMRAQGVIEGLQAKTHQLVLATQLVNMVLKIDDVRGPKDDARK